MKVLRKIITLIILTAFSVSGVIPPSYAQSLSLPAPTEMVALSEPFHPAVLRGLKLDMKDPFRFDFVVDQGDTGLSDEALKVAADELIRYFLATLTIPEKDLWVNLSPYESGRIIDDTFGRTAMGRDLLAQDYLLKQITSSLMHPDSELGKKFWDEVYRQAHEQFGTTDIPVETFNKVWIAPKRAVIFESKSDGDVLSAYVESAELKVMLETDYMAAQQALPSDAGLNVQATQASSDAQAISKQILREVIIPALEKEVNEGQNFASLRQVYHSLLLAVWLKQKLSGATMASSIGDNTPADGNILSTVFVNKKKTGGNELADASEQIGGLYERYVEAFHKGVYNLIREEVDLYSEEVIPRKYFSGGVEFESAMSTMEVRPSDSEFISRIRKTASMVLVTAGISIFAAGTGEVQAVSPTMARTFAANNQYYGFTNVVTEATARQVMDSNLNVMLKNYSVKKNGGSVVPDKWLGNPWAKYLKDNYKPGMNFDDVLRLSKAFFGAYYKYAQEGRVSRSVIGEAEEMVAQWWIDLVISNATYDQQGVQTDDKRFMSLYRTVVGNYVLKTKGRTFVCKSMAQLATIGSAEMGVREGAVSYVYTFKDSDGPTVNKDGVSDHVEVYVNGFDGRQVGLNQGERVTGVHEILVFPPDRGAGSSYVIGKVPAGHYGYSAAEILNDNEGDRQAKQAEQDEKSFDVLYKGFYTLSKSAESDLKRGEAHSAYKKYSEITRRRANTEAAWGTKDIDSDKYMSLVDLFSVAENNRKAAWQRMTKEQRQAEIDRVQSQGRVARPVSGSKEHAQSSDPVQAHSRRDFLRMAFWAGIGMAATAGGGTVSALAGEAPKAAPKYEMDKQVEQAIGTVLGRVQGWDGSRVGRDELFRRMGMSPEWFDYLIKSAFPLMKNFYKENNPNAVKLGITYSTNDITSIILGQMYKESSFGLKPVEMKDGKPQGRGLLQYDSPEEFRKDFNRVMANSEWSAVVKKMFPDLFKGEAVDNEKLLSLVHDSRLHLIVAMYRINANMERAWDLMNRVEKEKRSSGYVDTRHIFPVYEVYAAQKKRKTLLVDLAFLYWNVGPARSDKFYNTVLTHSLMCDAFGVSTKKGVDRLKVMFDAAGGKQKFVGKTSSRKDFNDSYLGRFYQRYGMAAFVPVDFRLGPLFGEALHNFMGARSVAFGAMLGLDTQFQGDLNTAKKDHAQSAAPSSETMDLYGGIDLNPDQLDMLIKGDVGELQFTLTPAQVQMLEQKIDGFIPVILNIQLLTDMPLFLGLADNNVSAS